MTTRFCSYHFTDIGCGKGDSCTYSHSTIPRIPRKCKGCAITQDLCPYLHEDETWTQGMRPIIHPSERKSYLAQELAIADKEIASLRLRISELENTKPVSKADSKSEEKWPRGGPSDKDTKPEKSEKPEKPEESEKSEKSEPVA
jgi:hypothetical protein